MKEMFDLADQLVEQGRFQADLIRIGKAREVQLLRRIIAAYDGDSADELHDLIEQARSLCQ